MNINKLLIAISFLFVTSCGGGPAESLTQFLVLQSTITEVNKALSSTIAQADVAAKNNIKNVQVSAQETLEKIDEIIKHGSDATAVQREEAIRQAFEVLATSQKLVDESGKGFFDGLNQTLASAAATLDAIPFVDIPDTVFAVTPHKVLRDSRDLEVSVYGFFPSLANDISNVTVKVNEESVAIKRSIGRVYFDLPKNLLNGKDRYANIKILLPKKNWFSSPQTPIQTRLKLLNNTPYKFNVEVYTTNKAAYETIAGNVRTESADSSSVNKNLTLTRVELFNSLVTNPEVNGKKKYNANSARIVNVTLTESAGVSPDTGCPNPTGRIGSWTDQAIYVELNAPNCSPHWVGGVFGYMAGGGGSWYRISFVPTFTVELVDVPKTILSNKLDSIRMKYGETHSVDLPSNWEILNVIMNYDDDFDHFSVPIYITKGKPVASSQSFSISHLGDNKLTISTMRSSAAVQLNANTSESSIKGLTTTFSRTINDPRLSDILKQVERDI